jgi:hypothetical protein
VEGWLGTFPELDGRPELLAALTAGTRLARSFRRALFKRLEVLHQVPFIPDDHLASHVLHLAYEHDKATFLGSWEGRDGLRRAAVAQAVSALKDAYRNSVSEIRERTQEARAADKAAKRRAAVHDAEATP